MTRWDLVYKWSDLKAQSLVDAVTSALDNCDRKLTEALALSGEREEGIERAIATVESSRLTHVHWADWRRKGHDTDEDHEMVGDLAFHEEAIAAYDHVLAVLRGLSGEREGIDLWLDDFDRKITTVLRDHWNHTGYGEPQCFEDEGEIRDWYDRASLFSLDCPACEALYALRSARDGYRSESRPNPRRPLAASLPTEGGEQ